MKNEKRLNIYVAGQTFPIITNEEENYIKKLAETVDTKIKSIQNSNPKLNRDGCATVAALDYCDEKLKLNKDVKNLRKQIKDYLEDSEKLRNEVKKLERENEKLNNIINKNEAFTNKVQEKKEEINKSKRLVDGGKIKKEKPVFKNGIKKCDDNEPLFKKK